MKEVEYSREALRTLRGTDRSTAQRIVAKIVQLSSEPTSLGNNVRMLKGGDGLMRLRVGDWRVIYRDGIVLALVRIASRGSAYS